MKNLALSILFLQVFCAYTANTVGIQEKFAGAVRQGNYLLADEYLRSGQVNVNAPIRYSEDFDVPPFIQATKKLNVLMMRVLFDHGANLRSKDSDGNTVLHHLATANRDPGIIVPLIDAFINRDVDVTARNEKGNTALVEAAEWQKNPEILEALMIHNSADKQEALAAAIDGYQPRNVSTLLLHGTSVTQRHKNLVRQYDRPFDDSKIIKKQKKCKNLIKKGTQSEYFRKHCFGRLPERGNDKKSSMFLMLKNREIAKKR